MGDKAVRLNAGKVRHDLVPPFAQDQYAKVLTKALNKYADRNWENGMEWTKVIASLKRHVLAIESGKDFDKEDGLLHSAHAMANAAFLTEYYKIYPQGDNRPRIYNGLKRVGLDVDDVVADFTLAWSNKFGIDRPKWWKFDRNAHEKWSKIVNDKDFWMNIPLKTDPDSIPFEPECFITARTIPMEWTMEWLDNNGFPAVPVVHSLDKVETAKKYSLDIFVDDKYETFALLNKSGVLCYLMDAAHNRRYDVGFKRIYTVDEIFEKNF